MADNILKVQIKSEDFLALEDKSTQLASLLRLIYGNGFNSFNALLDSDKDNILWIASDLAEKINELVQGE